MHATPCVASSRRRCIRCGLWLCAEPEEAACDDCDDCAEDDDDDGDEDDVENEECSTSTRSIRRCILYVAQSARALSSASAASSESARGAAGRECGDQSGCMGSSTCGTGRSSDDARDADQVIADKWAMGDARMMLQSRVRLLACRCA